MTTSAPWLDLENIGQLQLAEVFEIIDLEPDVLLDDPLALAVPDEPRGATLAWATTHPSSFSA